MHRDESSSPPPPEEDEWHTKIINALSGGAVDDARAILAFEATNPSTMDRSMFHMGLNARDVKSEFMGYGLGVRGTKSVGKGLSRIVSNTTKRAENAIQLTFDKKSICI